MEAQSYRDSTPTFIDNDWWLRLPEWQETKLYIFLDTWTGKRDSEEKEDKIDSFTH